MPIKLKSNERFVLLPFPKSPAGFRYVVTNYGRVISFQKSVEEDGRAISNGLIRGYPAVQFKLGKGKLKTCTVHRLVAEYFVKKPDNKHNTVLHINNKKTDNYYQNLRWGTDKDRVNSSLKIRRDTGVGNYKLTEDRVRLIKKKMLNGKTRLKIIAKQFGVSDMQIHRIKTGENWGHVKI